MRRFLPLFALFLALTGLSAAQDAAPLTGPLLATTNGAQDSVLIIQPQTGEIRAWSLGAGVHTVWDFSPDGCQMLVTVTGFDGMPRLYITALDGTVIREPVQYSELPREMWGIWEPDWSPDGSKIAFRMMRDGFEGARERQYHIGWVSPEGGEPAFYSVSGREHTPKWSPDSGWLAYVSYDKRPAGADSRSTAEPDIATATAPEDYIQEADLWVVSADGTHKTRKTTYVTGSVRAPRWSPDSRYIAYIFSPSGNNDTLWTVENVDNAYDVQVTYNYSLALDLTWTPDGRLFTSARGMGGQTTHALWSLPVKSGADLEAAQYIAQLPLPYPDYPAFSPDGTQIALRSSYRAALIDANGAVSFFAGAEGNMPIIWSPAAFSDETACP